MAFQKLSQAFCSARLQMPEIQHFLGVSSGQCATARNNLQQKSPSILCDRWLCPDPHGTTHLVFRQEGHFFRKGASYLKGEEWEEMGSVLIQVFVFISLNVLLPSGNQFV